MRIFAASRRGRWGIDLREYFGARESSRVFGRWKDVDSLTLRTLCELTPLRVALAAAFAFAEGLLGLPLFLTLPAPFSYNFFSNYPVNSFPALSPRCLQSLQTRLPGRIAADSASPHLELKLFRHLDTSRAT